MRTMKPPRDRLTAIGGALRKSYTLPERTSDRQFQDLLHRLSDTKRAPRRSD